MLKPLTSYACFTLSAAMMLSPLLLSAEEDLSLKEDLLTASIFSSSSGTGTELEKRNTSCCPDVRPYNVYIKHIEAKGIGYKEGYSTVGAFLIPYTSFTDILPFIDLRGHVFNNSKFAANAGIGARYLTEGMLMFGAGIYYDYRQTKHTHYNQISLGLETFGIRWEARLNGYLPVGSTSHTSKNSEIRSYNFDHFAGHHLFYSTTTAARDKIYFAMWGADAEYGYHIIRPRENFTVYAGIGPYYYRHSEHRHEKHAIGGKFRVEARVSPYWVFELSESFDNLFHNNVQGQVTFKVPFGTKIKKKKINTCQTRCGDILAMEARMVQPMHKQEIIVQSRSKRHYTTTSDPVAISVLGVPLNFQFVNNTSGGGDGTFEHPFNTLVAASAVSQVGDVFYVFPGDGTTTGMNTGITLLNNQQLLSSGVAQPVNILVNSTTQTVTIPALSRTLPSIGNSAGSAVTMNGSNTVVSGFFINQALSSSAIISTNSVSQFENITIKNNTIILSGTGTPSGITCTSISGTNLIANNTVINETTTAAQTGINFDIDDDLISNVTLKNNSITGGTFTNAAMLVRTNNITGSAELHATVTGNTISSCTASSGLAIISDFAGQTFATITNNNIFNISSSGMIFNSIMDQGHIGATVSNNTITGCGGEGIQLQPLAESSQYLEFTNNVISQNPIGINTGGMSDTGRLDWIFSGNNISRNGGSSMNLLTNGTDAHITINGNILFNNGDGVNISNTATGTDCVRITNNTNSLNYTITNNNTGGVDFILEPFSNNTGNLILITGTGTGNFVFVEPGTCAPSP